MAVDVLQTEIPLLHSSFVGMMAFFPGDDTFSVCIVLFGILCQLARRRLPAGLGTSLFVCATTVGVGWAAFSHDWPDLHLVPQVQSRYLALTLLSGFSTLWAFFGWWAAKRHEGHADDGASSSAAFMAWSLVSGIAASVLMIFVLVFATWSRLLNPDSLAEKLTGIGLLHLSLLVLSVLFWMATVQRPKQPVMLLSLATLAAWWWGLMIPPAVGSYVLLPHARADFQPFWWTWTFQVQLGFAMVLVGAAVLQEWRYRAKRRRAWPDRLDDLVEPYSRWPAYIQLEAIIAAAILVLGVFQIVRPGTPSWQIAVASGIVTAAAGFTCLFMTYRRWSGNTAGLGLSLVTLAAVIFSGAMAVPFGAVSASTPYAVRIPILYNAALFAMAFMAVFWRWLAGVWDQQLLDGMPWTTTGRIIPHAALGSFLITAMAVLIAFGMALWPRNVVSSAEDDSLGRIVAGVTAILLLTLVTARNARREDSIAEATQAVALILAALAFVFIRLPTSGFRGWVIQYEPFFLGVVCVPVLICAEALAKTRWRSFAAPLWWLALLIFPMRALILLLPTTRLPAEWVRPVTLTVFGVLYLIAGCREHRRPFLVLGAVLVVAAFISTG